MGSTSVLWNGYARYAPNNVHMNGNNESLIFVFELGCEARHIDGGEE